MRKFLDTITLLVSIIGVIYILSVTDNDLVVRLGLVYLLGYVPIHLILFWWRSRREG